MNIDFPKKCRLSVENCDSEKLRYLLLLLLCVNLSVLFSFGSYYVHGIEIYSKNEKAFDLPLESWLGKFWIWWAAVPSDIVPPKDNGCLINSSDSMVMLMETTVTGAHHQICNITSAQAIFVPLWVSFMEDSINQDGEQPRKGFSYEQLSDDSRKTLDLGVVTSRVKVDGVTVANLDVDSSMSGGVLDYKINSMNNVTELYSKGFNITIPENTHLVDQNPGTWRSGAHGWVVVLKPLPSGEHTIFYNVCVNCADPKPENRNAAEITYSLHVK
jgi:hypothetical protein